MQWTWAKYGWINPIVINLLFCSSRSHEVLKKILRKLSLTRLLRLIPLAYQTSIFTCTKVKFTCPRQCHPFFFSCPALWSWQPTLESVWLINITLHKLQVIDQSINHFPHIAGKITCPEHDYQSDTLSAWLFLLGRVAVPQETQNLGLSLDIVTLLCWLVCLFGVFHKFSTCQRCIR